MTLKIVIGYSGDLHYLDLVRKYFPAGTLVVEETLDSSDRQYTNYYLPCRRHFKSSFLVVRDLTEREKEVYSMVYPEFF